MRNTLYLLSILFLLYPSIQWSACHSADIVEDTKLQAAYPLLFDASSTPWVEKVSSEDELEEDSIIAMAYSGIDSTWSLTQELSLPKFCDDFFPSENSLDDRTSELPIYCALHIESSLTDSHSQPKKSLGKKASKRSQTQQARILKEQGDIARRSEDESDSDEVKVKMESFCTDPTRTPWKPDMKGKCGHAPTKSDTKITKRLYDQVFQATELQLYKEKNVVAIFRYQINIRKDKVRRLQANIAKMSSKNDSFLINLCKQKEEKWQQEIAELQMLQMLEEAENNFNKKKSARERRRLMLNDFQSRVVTKKRANPREKIKCIAIEELRTLTQHEVQGDKAELKSAQSRVTDYQVMDVCTGEENHELRDGAMLKYRDVETVSSEDKECMTAMMSPGVGSARHLDCLNQGVEVEGAPTLASPVFDEAVIKMAIVDFMLKGKVRVFQEPQLLASREKIKDDGPDAKTELSKIYQKLASYRRTRKQFLLLLMHDRNLTLQNITDVINSMLKEAQEIEKLELDNLLKVSKEMKAENKGLKLQDLAAKEDRARAKRREYYAAR